LSINWLKYFVILFLFAHDHIKITGDFAFSISEIKFKTSFSPISGLLTFFVFKFISENSSGTSSAAISSANSIATAHGFSLSAILKAFSRIYGTLTHEGIEQAYFVIGFIIETISTI
jgi:hypothetical protein